MLEPTDRGVYGAFRSSGAAGLFPSPSHELSAHLSNVQKEQSEITMRRLQKNQSEHASLRKQQPLRSGQ
eukprot:5616730-Prymnesium_polylepis.1